MTDAEIVEAWTAGVYLSNIIGRSKRPLEDVRRVLVAAGAYLGRSDG